MAAAKDPTATAVRGSWAAWLNAAAERRPVVFHRGDQDFALVPASLLRDVLRRAVRLLPRSSRRTTAGR
jgi:hypothetical protein